MKLEVQKELDSIYPSATGDLYFGVGDGWAPLLRDLLIALKALDLPPNFKVTDIKEKYGGLRFYTNFSNDAVDDLIDQAESKSLDVCELCGEPGEVKAKGYWLSTRCAKCR